VKPSTDTLVLSPSRVRSTSLRCNFNPDNDKFWLRDPDLVHKGNRVIHNVTLSSPYLQHQCRLFTLGVQWPKWAPSILL
jgi:hypothetical protein